MPLIEPPTWLTRLGHRLRIFYHGKKIRKKDRLILIDEEYRCRNPIFLIGLHRSGTTLLRLMIDAHTRIACPPETFFLLDLEKALRSGRFLRGLESLGFYEKDALKTLGRGMATFYEAYAQSKNKPRWADKTPGYGFILPFIEALFGPNSQFLVIYRHPLDVVNSLQALEWSKWDERYDEDPFLDRVKYVAHGLAKQYAFQQRHADRCFAVYYDKLTADPRRVMSAVFEFLGEPWEEGVLTYYDQEHDFGVGDIGAQVRRRIVPKLGTWNGWNPADVDRAWQELGPIAAELGYSRDSPHATLRADP